jgi:hypothetical protein
MSPRRAFAVSGAFAIAAIGAGCDPREDAPVTQDGTPFLIVAPSDRPADVGTALYIQARGGNWVTISTDACSHTVTKFSGVNRSCSQVPYFGAAPLEFTADPEDVPCTLTVGLYSLCACDDGGPVDFTSGPSYFDWCDGAGTLITTQSIRIGPSDGMTDAGPGLDGS